MNFDEESKSKEKKFFLCGGGGEGGGELNTRATIFYIRHTGTTSSTEPYRLIKIFLMVFKIEGIVALTIKGR